MLDVLLWAGAALWILILLQLLVNRALSPDLSRRRPDPQPDCPPVSIVVPARNEERSIREAVSSFCSQVYPDFEVIVVDDRSTDATPEILAELATRFSTLQVVEGVDPPPGWLGKPNALQIGTSRARGEWILFVDADVVYAPDLLARAVAHARQRRVAMLVLFPNFTTGGVIEASLMSCLYFIGMAVAPLWLVMHSRSRHFAAGGGVFNLVHRDALRACGAFESLRNEVIDDVGLGYRVKATGARIAVALSGPLMKIRMYHGARETVRGFTKNVYPLFRPFPWALPVPFVGGFVMSLLPYYGLVRRLFAGEVSIPACISLALMHLVFALIAVFFRQPWAIVFLNPVRELGWWWIFLRSLIAFHRRGVVWRGRTYGAP